MTTNDKRTPRQFTRRDILRLGGRGALMALLAGSALKYMDRPLVAPARAGGAVEPGRSPARQPANIPAMLPRVDIRLVATDGYMSLPGRRRDATVYGGQPEDSAPLFAFGFRGVEPGETFATADQLIQKYKFKVQWPAPILGVPKDIDLYITMTNLGLFLRPDLDDSHTIHWHGFRNPNAIFDGVPEMSIAVPVSRDFPYFYRPRVEGTYMYHCHFEDSEHVQMGMDGVAYIKANNGHAYDNDSPVSTAFDREFTFMLNEVDTTPHDNLEAVQEFIWSDYEPNYWIMNGRAYPDTIIRDQELDSLTDFKLADFDPDGIPGSGDEQATGYSQPISSLVQLEEGETALLRFANLGYQQHTMQLLGPRMTVVGHDATYLGDQAYQTDSIYIGPGEARDALFTAPAYGDIDLPVQTDGAGNYKAFWLRNRNAQRLVNGDLPGLGGMLTQVRVYPAGTLGPQAGPNKTI